MLKTSISEESGDDFSPVKTKGSSTCQKSFNLTGSHRKMKDTAADLHNLCQKWSKFNTEGTACINQIANIRLQNIFKEEEARSHEDTEIPHKLEHAEVLGDHCNRLSDIVGKMRKVADKMEAIAILFKGIAELECHKAEVDTQAEGPILFQTWTVSEFEHATVDILDMYQKELELKQLIVENVCHTDDRNTIMFYTAAWVHQPYIDCSGTLLVESMLTETGHR